MATKVPAAPATKSLNGTAHKPGSNGNGGGANGPLMRRKPGRMVYFFGKTKAEGNGTMKLVLGGKGANLAEMTSIGIL